MTDLERLFRRLVDNLIAIDPTRLHRPLLVGEIRESIVPYRTNRRALELDTMEDYDMLLLRLVAGEGGYVRMVSEESRARFHQETESPNPDLTLLTELAEAELQLATDQLAHALGPDPEVAFAPPEEDEEEAPPERPRATGPVARMALDAVRFTIVPPEPLKEPPPATLTRPTDPVPIRSEPAGSRCGFCGGRLPSGRTVNFCPHCGQNQSFTRCPECQAEIELGWKHCIVCGHLVGVQ
jgi:hypothetical protein